MCSKAPERFDFGNKIRLIFGRNMNSVLSFLILQGFETLGEFQLI
jgi:hypothetical protein